MSEQAPFCPPCRNLNPEQLAHRVASHMRVFGNEARVTPEFAHRKRTPGFCVLCGTRLSLTWRAVKCVRPASEDCPNGEFAIHEFDHSKDSADKLAAVFAKYAAVVHGRLQDGVAMETRNGYSLWKITACEAITPDVSKAASAIAVARYREICASATSATQDPPVRQDRSEFAARALARGME